MPRKDYAKQLDNMEDISVEDLKKIKLDAEIRQTLSAITTTPIKDGYLKELKNWIALIMTFVTLSGAVLAVWINWSGYRKERRVEKQISFSKEILELVKQLNSADKTDRENALLLLGYFKMNALPILINYLETDEKPQMVIRSLKLIQRNIDKPELVTNRVLKSAEQIFNLRDVTTDETITAYINFIKALGEVGTYRKETIVSILNDIKSDIASSNSPKRKFNPLKKDFILEDIEIALEKLNRVRTSRESNWFSCSQNR